MQLVTMFWNRMFRQRVQSVNASTLDRDVCGGAGLGMFLPEYG